MMKSLSVRLEGIVYQILMVGAKTDHEFLVMAC